MTQTRLYSPNLLAWPKPASESFTLTGIEDHYQVIKYWGNSAVLRGFITTFIQKSDDLSDDVFDSPYYDIVPERTHEDFQRGYHARMNRVRDRLHEYVDIDLPLVEEGANW